MFTFSVLDQKNPFWENLVKKNQNCQLKEKFGTKTNLNMRSSMTILTFSVFDRKYLFVKIWPKNQKNQNCQFELKFRTRLI